MTQPNTKLLPILKEIQECIKSLHEKLCSPELLKNVKKQIKRDMLGDAGLHLEIIRARLSNVNVRFQMLKDFINQNKK